MSFISTKIGTGLLPDASSALGGSARAVRKMQVYFTIGEPTGPDDEGVDCPDIDQAFREAQRTVLLLAAQNPGDGMVRLNVYTNGRLAGSAVASLKTTRC
jgi:hypothetical protein